MKKILSLLVLGIFLFGSPGFSQTAPPSSFQTGDLIFQTSQSRQSEAIRIATDSRYSHVGMIVMEAGKPAVLEAVQPVKITPLQSWITHGKDRHYVVKRLKSPPDADQQEALSQAGKKYLGRNYDLYFNWDDSEIYCSELVWKVYEEVLGVELGAMRKLADFNLDSPIVAAKLKERYGNQIPLEETVISPEDIFRYKGLETIFNLN